MATWVEILRHRILVLSREDVKDFEWFDRDNKLIDETTVWNCESTKIFSAVHRAVRKSDSKTFQPADYYPLTYVNAIALRELP